MKDQMVRVAKEFAADESGVGVVEMILILVVLICLLYTSPSPRDS